MAKKSIITPKGTLLYAWLFKPDTKYDENGKYRTKLVLEAADAQPHLEAIKTALQEAVETEVKARTKAGKSPKVKTEDLPVTVREDGKVELSFSTRAKFKSKETGELVAKTLAVFGPDNKPFTAPPGVIIGSGCTAKVAYSIRAYEAKGAVGVTLDLNAVQLIEIREYVPDGGAFGFSAESPAEAETAAPAFPTEAPGTDGDF